MEALSNRKTAVLDVLDREIATLEKKLEKVQPLINELNQLRATRRVLLNEKGVTSGAGTRNMLDMESVVLFLKENGPSAPKDIATHTGATEGSVRSHLHRHRDTRYAQNGDGLWHLTEDTEDEEEGDE